MSSEKGRTRRNYLGAALLFFAGLGLAQSSCSSSGPAPKKPADPPAAATASSPAGAIAESSVPANAANPAPLSPVDEPKLCQGRPFCFENADFAVTVTNVRTSLAPPYRVFAATLKFENKRSKPLTLGYMAGSGVALDEKGNRYNVGGANAFRGIGQISGGSIDAKFAIQPSSSAEARFELVGSPNPVGVIFELDLSVSEIKEGTPHTVGAEYPLTFRGLTNELRPPDADKAK